jgi:hypothetical protein
MPFGPNLARNQSQAKKRDNRCHGYRKNHVEPAAGHVPKSALAAQNLLNFFSVRRMILVTLQASHVGCGEPQWSRQAAYELSWPHF